MHIPPAGSQRVLLESTKIGHATVKVYIDADDIYIQGSGLKLCFPEKPNLPMVVISHKPGPAGRLLNDDSSKRELVDLGERWRREVHARIRRDWGEKCFSPDEYLKWHHPLFNSSGTHFSCHHCEQIFTGAAVAEALWHCPSPDCNGSPIDLYCVAAPTASSTIT